MTETAFVISQLAAADSPEDVFEVDISASADEQLSQLKKSFRQLARVVHPYSSDQEETSAAFICLEQLYEEAREAIGRGRYGKRTVTLHSHRRRPSTGTGATARTTFGRYEVVERLATGDVGNVFLTEAGSERFVLKIAQQVAENDLMAHEAEALSLLHADDAVEGRLKPYVPVLLDSFTHGVSTGSLKVNVTPYYEGFYNLEQVRRAYPDGIHWRDMAWMFRRMLVAVGYAHVNGLVHGAVLPEHILIHPTDHGLILIDWCYHAKAGEKVDASVSAYRDWYPPEALNNEVAGPETDIFMVARCAQYLLGADAPSWQVKQAPPKLRAFFNGCALSARTQRPDDAWELLGEFDDLIGPREYRPFSMPPLDGGSQPGSSGPSAASTSTRRSD